MNFLKKILRIGQAPDPLIEVRISEEAIIKNYRSFLSTYGTPIAPVLKSNAYGHGLLEVAGILESQKPPLIIVDSYYEAQVLRGSGLRTPILIIGYARPETIIACRLKDVAFTLTSLESIKVLTRQAVVSTVHIKFDTGMRRQGLLPSESEEAIKLLKESRLKVDGVCSHFADADGSSDEFTTSQIGEWNKLTHLWRSAFPNANYFHLAATAGSAFSKPIDANLIRLGTGLYGFPRHNTQESLALTPALSLHTILTGIKNLAVGESVGYNRTFVATSQMRIATIPVGYFEGIDRRLSNTGSVSVSGRNCPIIGRVSMNITIVDVTNCPSAEIGSSVVVFSDKTEDVNSVKQLANLCNTTPLELLVHIPEHLRRTIV